MEMQHVIVMGVKGLTISPTYQMLSNFFLKVNDLVTSHAGITTPLCKRAVKTKVGRGRVYTVNPHIANIIHKRMSGIFDILRL